MKRITRSALLVFLAILLIAAIAFGCGFGGAYAYNYAVGKGWVPAAQAGRTTQSIESGAEEAAATGGQTAANTVSIKTTEDTTMPSRSRLTMGSSTKVSGTRS